jgi:hypothetical protein
MVFNIIAPIILASVAMLEIKAVLLQKKLHHGCTHYCEEWTHQTRFISCPLRDAMFFLTTLASIASPLVGSAGKKPNVLLVNSYSCWCFSEASMSSDSPTLMQWLASRQAPVEGGQLYAYPLALTVYGLGCAARSLSAAKVYQVPGDQLHQKQVSVIS